MEKIMDYNKKFVNNKQYKPFQTTSQPDKNIVIVTCMDTRLIELLPAALGTGNGDVNIIKNAGGMITSLTDSAMRSLIISIYAFDVTNIMVIGHDDCGMETVDNSYLIANMTERGISEELLHQLDMLNFDTLKWLHGFDDVEESVRKSVDLVKKHPLISHDVCIQGFVMNPYTGELRCV